MLLRQHRVVAHDAMNPLEIDNGLPILDEFGYLPFNASGGALLFHLLTKLYERTSVIITTDLSFSEWATVFGDARLKALRFKAHYEAIRQLSEKKPEIFIRNPSHDMLGPNT